MVLVRLAQTLFPVQPLPQLRSFLPRQLALQQAVVPEHAREPLLLCINSDRRRSHLVREEGDHVLSRTQPFSHTGTLWR